MASNNVSNQTEYKLAEHPALDYLNTQQMSHGKLVDVFYTAQDVAIWLAARNLGNDPLDMPPALLQSARLFRDTLRHLVEQRVAGKRVNLTAMNPLLRSASSYPEIVQEGAARFKLRRIRPQVTPEQILGPLAEAAAELLVSGDFSLIRQCEDPSCVLWFYDRTKSHGRRWCSAATCGNRNKVASFRKRRALNSV